MGSINGFSGGYYGPQYPPARGGAYPPESSVGSFRDYINGITGEASNTYRQAMAAPQGGGGGGGERSGGLLSKIPIVGGLFNSIGSVVEKIPIIGGLLGGLF